MAKLKSKPKLKSKKKSGKKRYFKLGKGADTGSFTNTASGLVIRGKEVVSIDPNSIGNANAQIKEALNNGHIVELSKEEAGDNVVSLPLEFPKPKEREVAFKGDKFAKAELKDEDEEEEEEKIEDEEDDIDDDDDPKKK